MDPKDFKGSSPEANDLNKGLEDNRGVYVLRSSKLPAERQDEEDKFLEATSNPAADAFVRLGYEKATDKEAKAYRTKGEDAKQSQLDSMRKESAGAKALAEAEQTRIDAKKGDTEKSEEPSEREVELEKQLKAAKAAQKKAEKALKDQETETPTETVDTEIKNPNEQ